MTISDPTKGRHTMHRKRTEDALRDSEARLHAIIDAEPECVKLLAANGSLLEMNPAGLRMIEAETLDEVKGRLMHEIVGKEYRKAFRELTKKVFRGESGILEFEIVGLKGTPRWLETHASPLRDADGKVAALLGITRDVTEHKQAEAMVTCQTKVLEKIALGAPLTETLDTLLRLLEGFAPGLLCSILVLDADGTSLRHCSAPSLPASFTNAIDGEQIGPKAGSCGTAAYRREQVVVEEIATDPLWADYRGIAEEHGLRACWSTPIFDDKQGLLGTFAIYYRQPGPPSDTDRRCIELATSLAAIAINRHRSQASLSESIARTQLLVKSSNIGLWDWDIVTNEVYFSPEWKGQLGYSDDELNNQFDEWESRLHPDDAGPTMAAIGEFLEGKRSDHEVEFRLRHKDGSWRWIFTRADLVRDASGRAIRMMGCHVDITQRKQAEASLRETRLRLESALAAGSVGTWVWDLVNNRAYADEYLSELFSIERESDAEGEALDAFFNAIHEEDRPRVQDAIERTIKLDEKYDIEFRVLPLDGKPRWLLGRGRIERDTAGNALRFLGMLMDITERKRVEVALRETQDHLESVMTAGSVGAWTWDIVNNRAFVDDFVSELFSIPRESDAEGGSLDAFFRAIHQEDLQRVQTAMDQTLKFDEKFDIEFRIVPPDGTLRWVLARGRCERDATGNPVRFLGMTMNVTDRRQAESALRETEERFSTIFKAAPGSMMLFSMPDGKTVEVNDNFSIITGYTREEAIGKTTAELGMWADPKARERMLALVAKNGTVSNFEADLRHRSGAIRNGLVSGHMIQIQDTNYLLGVFSDITELKRAEKERQVIFDVIQGAISTPDLDEFLRLVHGLIGQIVYAENCFVMLHEPADDMVHFEFWADKYDPPPPDHLARKGFSNYVLRTGKPLLLTDELAKEMQASGEADLVGSASPSWLGVPLRTPERTIGVLVLQHYEEHNAFSERDLGFMASVGDQIALAIERKWAEDAAQVSEERYRDLVENAIDMIYTQDLDGNYTSINAAAEKITGYTREETLTRNLAQSVAPEQREKIVRQMKAAILSGTDSTAYELEIIAKDGRRIAVEVNTRIIRENGVPVGVQGIARDITERKRIDDELRESEQKYRAILDNIEDGYFEVDIAGNLTFFNDSLCDIFGYSRIELLGMNNRTFMDDENARKVYQTFNQVYRTGIPARAFDWEIIRKDGTMRFIEASVSQRKDPKGQSIGFRGVLRDITARKEAEEALRFSEEQLRQSLKLEAVGQLAGGIAHDFNNLLTAINGYSQLALRKLPADDPVRINVEEITKAGERAAALTRQLLAFSRKQVLTPTVHNLNTVITEIEKMLKRLIRENIELRTVLAPDLGNIKADPGQIEQVIVNLAVNARDAMPHGGTLTIETQNIEIGQEYVSGHIAVEPGQYIKMTVTDTGEGMDEKTRSRIFEPFFTTKAVGSGTGLGLSTVHGIVSQSGGSIQVYSEPGHGTTFKIYLPCIDENVQRPRWRDEPGEDLSGNETILLVEDEDVVRGLVREILIEKGYTVLEAASGKGALSICSTYEKPIDLLFTDIVMPKMSGDELSVKVVKLRPDIKVLFMSGYTDESVAHRGIIESNAPFIEKPFTPEALARKVRAVLAS